MSNLKTKTKTMMTSFLEYLLEGQMLEADSTSIQLNAFKEYIINDNTDKVNQKIDKWFPIEKSPIRNKMFKKAFSVMFSYDKEHRTNYFNEFTMDLQNANTIRITNSKAITADIRNDVIDQTIQALKSSSYFDDVKRSGNALNVPGNWIGIAAKHETKSNKQIWIKLHIMSSDKNSNSTAGSLITEVLTAMFTYAYANDSSMLSKLNHMTADSFISFVLDKSTKSLLVDEHSVIDSKSYARLAEFIQNYVNNEYLNRKISEGIVLGNKAVQFFKENSIDPKSIANVHLSNSNRKTTTEDVAFDIRSDNKLMPYGFSCKAGTIESGHAMKEARYKTIIESKVLTIDEWDELFQCIDVDHFVKYLGNDLQKYRIASFREEYEIDPNVYLKFVQENNGQIFKKSNALRKLILFMLSAGEKADRTIVILNAAQKKSDENTIRTALVSALSENSFDVVNTQAYAQDSIYVMLKSHGNEFKLGFRFGNGKLKIVQIYKDSEFRFSSKNSKYLTSMSIKLSSITAKSR